MKIEHIAVWTQQLEQLKAFYIRFFGAVASEKYFNPNRSFSSYFLSFNTGTRLELMQVPGLLPNSNQETGPVMGIAHFAMSVGSKEQVDNLTEELRIAGYKVLGEPRRTGDGYYESVIADPDNNLIEITI
jgi:lactoylglutathione lyase